MTEYCKHCGEPFKQYKIMRRRFFSKEHIPFNNGKESYKDCKLCGSELHLMAEE
jgi:hypothetical protein